MEAFDRPEREGSAGTSSPKSKDELRAEMFDIADREWKRSAPARRRPLWLALLGWFFRQP